MSLTVLKGNEGENAEQMGLFLTSVQLSLVQIKCLYSLRACSGEGPAPDSKDIIN